MLVLHYFYSFTYGCLACGTVSPTTFLLFLSSFSSPPRYHTFTFISVSFGLWSTKINQGHLDDDGFGAICGSPVGSEVRTQLKAMIFLSIPEFISRKQATLVDSTIPIRMICSWIKRGRCWSERVWLDRSGLRPCTLRFIKESKQKQQVHMHTYVYLLSYMSESMIFTPWKFQSIKACELISLMVALTC